MLVVKTIKAFLSGLFQWPKTKAEVLKTVGVWGYHLTPFFEARDRMRVGPGTTTPLLLSEKDAKR